MLTSSGIEARGLKAMKRLEKRSRTESVTFGLKTTQDAVVSNQTLSRVDVERYRDEEIDSSIEILVSDRRLRVAVGDFTGTPTKWSSVTRADGTVWKVMSVGGGPGTPFWIMQLRR